MKGFVYKLPAESQKKNFLFNMLGSLTNAIVSLSLMVVVSYLTNSATAGVFSLSFSTAQMMYTICVFEMRNIQVTDAKREFSFRHISMFRMLTIVAAWIVVVAFVKIQKFDHQEASVTLVITLYMTAAAISDLFQGNLHRNGYLSIAGRSLAGQVVIMAVSFSVTLAVTRELLYAAIAMPIAVTVWIFIHDMPYSNNFDKFKPKFEIKPILKMLLCAVPLFASSFAHQYIFNSPKYAIDKVLTETDQAHYGYLVMPVFAINLLSIFIFRPQLVALSNDWLHKNFKSFKKTVTKLYIWVVAVTALALAGGYLLGIPILELLYNADLSDKKPIFMVLLLAGGFSAASTLTLTLFTTMRMQVFCLIAYAVTLGCSFVIPTIMTNHWGLMGAALSYLCEMAILFVIMFIMFLINVGSRKQ